MMWRKYVRVQTLPDVLLSNTPNTLSERAAPKRPTCPCQQQMIPFTGRPAGEFGITGPQIILDDLCNVGRYRRLEGTMSFHLGVIKTSRCNRRPSRRGCCRFGFREC